MATHLPYPPVFCLKNTYLTVNNELHNSSKGGFDVSVDRLDRLFFSHVIPIHLFIREFRLTTARVNYIGVHGSCANEITDLEQSSQSSYEDQLNHRLIDWLIRYLIDSSSLKSIDWLIDWNGSLVSSPKVFPFGWSLCLRNSWLVLPDLCTDVDQSVGTGLWASGREAWEVECVLSGRCE
jgi:hypothetical protein